MDLGRVRLADVECSDIDTAEGAQAEDYTTQWLQDRQIFLDLDNRTGLDRYNRGVAVVYLIKANGTVDTSRNFNQMSTINAGYSLPGAQLQERSSEGYSNSPKTLLQFTSPESSNILRRVFYRLPRVGIE